MATRFTSLYLDYNGRKRGHEDIIKLGNCITNALKYVVAAFTVAGLDTCRLSLGRKDSQIMLDKAGFYDQVCKGQDREYFNVKITLKACLHLEASYLIKMISFILLLTLHQRV